MQRIAAENPKAVLVLQQVQQQHCMGVGGCVRTRVVVVVVVPLMFMVVVPRAVAAAAAAATNTTTINDKDNNNNHSTSSRSHSPVGPAALVSPRQFVLTLVRTALHNTPRFQAVIRAEWDLGPWSPGL